MDNKVAYLCDPNKNTECSKTGCLYRYMAPDGCFLTCNPLYARDDAEPLTSDMLNEAVPAIQNAVNREIHTLYDRLEYELLHGSDGVEPIGLCGRE